MLRIQNDHFRFAKKTLFLFAFLVFTNSLSVLGQNQEWLSWSNGNNISSLGIDGNTIWAGTTIGLVKLALCENEWVGLN
ncbi:MAG: hypothetical protein J0L62_11675 [Bacteroidetes bacterium]|nr:hypothetical protein [Bacteroidota bacterium]